MQFKQEMTENRRMQKRDKETEITKREGRGKKNRKVKKEQEVEEMEAEDIFGSGRKDSK